jgi:hypothetical protein
LVVRSPKTTTVGSQRNFPGSNHKVIEAFLPRCLYLAMSCWVGLETSTTSGLIVLASSEINVQSPFHYTLLTSRRDLIGGCEATKHQVLQASDRGYTMSTSQISSKSLPYYFSPHDQVELRSSKSRIVNFVRVSICVGRGPRSTMLFQIDQRVPIWSAVASIGEPGQDVGSAESFDDGFDGGD